MSNKNLTQGGQVVFYMISMFLQINRVIFNYLLIAFVFFSFFFFAILNASRLNAIKMGYYYYKAKLFSFGTTGNTEIVLGNKIVSATYNDIINNKEFIKAGEFLLNQIYISLISSFITCLIIGILVYKYLINKGKNQGEDEYVSGRLFEEDYKKVAKQIKKKKLNSNIVISGLPLIKDTEIQNILVHGTVGTGKSTIINQFILQAKLRSLTAQGDKIIIFDRGNSFVPKFYDDKNDYILNPLDARCASWSLWDECKTAPDFDNFAASLIPEHPGTDPFWVNAPRTIVSSVAYKMKDDSPTYEKFLDYLFNADLSQLRRLLKNTEAENLVDSKAEKTTASIRSVITTYAKSLKYLQGLDKNNGTNKKIIIKDWITNPDDKGVLYITSGSEHETIKSLITAWISIAISALFELGESRNRRVWFVLDEIRSLYKLPFLQTMLAEGRKFGSCFLIGIQNTAQLEEIYGQKAALAMLDLLNTRYFFRSPDIKIAKEVSERIGTAKYLAFNEQYAYGKSDVRDGVSFNKKEEDKPIVNPNDLIQLPDLTCYVTYPVEIPVTKLKLKYIPFPEKCCGFIKRDVSNIELINKQKNTKVATSSNSNNDGQEVKFTDIHTTTTKEIKKSSETEMKKNTKEPNEIGNRDEDNINENPHQNYEEYQL